MHLSLRSLFRKRKKEDSTSDDCSNEKFSVKVLNEQSNLPKKNDTQTSAGSFPEDTKEGSESDIKKDFREPSLNPSPSNQSKDSIEMYEKLGNLEEKIKEDQRKLIEHYINFQRELMLRAPKILCEEINKAKQHSPVVKIPEIREPIVQDKKDNGNCKHQSSCFKLESSEYVRNPKINEGFLPITQDLHEPVSRPKDKGSSPGKGNGGDILPKTQYTSPDMDSPMLREIVLGEYEKPLLSRFGSITKILQYSPLIDLKTYERINQFIAKEKKYYQNILAKSGSNLLEDFFNINEGELEKRLNDCSDVKELSNYTKESIVGMKKLYNQLLKLKTKENQFPEDEIIDILKGKKVDISGESACYKDCDGRPIEYLKGNHFWKNRCDNIIKYFEAHKNENLQLMDYIIDLLSEESSKLKDKTGEPKITDYVTKIKKMDETVAILKDRYKSLVGQVHKLNDSKPIGDYPQSNKEISKGLPSDFSKDNKSNDAYDFTPVLVPLYESL